MRLASHLTQYASRAVLCEMRGVLPVVTYLIVFQLLCLGLPIDGAGAVQSRSTGRHKFQQPLAPLPLRRCCQLLRDL